jgi:hydroxymethylbilane synthase
MLSILSSMKHFVIGSRESELALVQTNSVLHQLQNHFPDYSFSINAMTTTGDEILNVPLSQVGGKALFTKELEVALEEKKVDFIVHSLKDVPTILPPGMTLGAILERENPKDVLILHPNHISNKVKNLAELPRGSVIGTSSVRRRAQLQRRFPHLDFKDIVIEYNIAR